MAVPCALIASCTDLNPRDLVKQMLLVETLPTAEHVLEEVEAYPWHVDTKYYTADVKLCTTDTRTIGNEEFANSVQALILIFDSKQEATFEQVKSWLPFAKEIDATVEMLVCKRCDPDDAVPKSRVQAWCLKNSFELVELDPETFSDEEEDDFPETTGVKRIVQALHAHMWPNLEMKDSPSFRSPYMNQMMANEAEHKRTQSENAEEGELAAAETNQAEVAAKNLPMTDTVSDPLGESSQTPPGASGGEATDIPVQPIAVATAKATTASARPSKEEKERANRQAASQDSRQAASQDSRQAASQDSRQAASQDSRQAASQDSSQAASQDSSQAASQESSQAAGPESSQQAIDSLINNDDIALFSSLGNEEPSDESFEQLFEKMQIMKQRAENLPPDQRRAYAEKVAVTFWKAIGGDEDEIDGLSDDDDP